MEIKIEKVVLGVGGTGDDLEKGFKLLNEISKLVEKNLKEGKYIKQPKAKKAFDEKKKKTSEINEFALFYTVRPHQMF